MSNRDYVEQMLYDIRDAPLAWQMNFLQGKFKCLYQKNIARDFIFKSSGMKTWIKNNNEQVLNIHSRGSNL